MFGMEVAYTCSHTLVDLLFRLRKDTEFCMNRTTCHNSVYKDHRNQDGLYPSFHLISNPFGLQKSKYVPFRLKVIQVSLDYSTTQCS